MTRRDKRRKFTEWIRQMLGVKPSRVSRRCARAIRLESLEGRQLMAVDPFMLLLGSAHKTDQSLATGSSSPSVIATAAPISAANMSLPNVQAEGEGEPANDLVAFAKAIAATNTKFYGGAWCTFCNQQKALFEDGAKYLPFVDVTNPDRTPNALATANNITTYPTWVFPNGSRLEEVQTLATISQRTGIAIPQSSTPFIEPLPSVTVRTGSPQHIPVDAYHPNGSPLTVSVVSDNPNLVSAAVLTGNRSLRIATDFGDMVFELYEDKAPRAAGRVIQLAQSGFYNNQIFHRVINNPAGSLVIAQGGDPTGTGEGGSQLGDFDDQFNLDLQHNRAGVLSFAKTTDDTNDSQFFVTGIPTRHLDFNHSVFGQLVDGESNRNAINNTATNSSGRPTNDVRMNSVTVFDDTENGLVVLKRIGTGTGTANITVTVSDGQGNTTSRTFAATVGQDTANGAPFLNDIPALQVAAGSTLNHTLTSQDKEGDQVTYSVEPIGNTQMNLSVNGQTGVVSLTPPANFVGQLQFLAKVRQTAQATTQDTFDTQVVRVQVNATAALGLSLQSTSDSGQSNSDRVTNSTSLNFSVTGTSPGATVEVLAGSQVVGTATASSATTQVTVANAGALAEGSVVFTARQIVGGQTNATSAALTATLDRTAPVQLFTGVLPATIFAGTALNVDLAHAEEVQGLRYALENAPVGMSVGLTDGRISWTPQQSQLGARTFTLVLTDLAGNERRQSFSVEVGLEPLLGIRLATVSIAGAALNTIQTGQTFKVQVYVQDQRALEDRDGVYSAFTNLAFNPSVIQPIAGSPIDHIAPYRTVTRGTVTNGKIEGLGGVSSETTPLGSNERLLAEVTFTAIAVGNAGLRTESSNVEDTVLFSGTAPLQPGQINFGTSNFAVGLNFTVNNDIFNFDEDANTQTLNVLTNDTLGAGVVLNITQVSTPSVGGTVTIAPDGRSLRYTPTAQFHGALTFTYTAANVQGLSQSATVTVQVTEVNDPPNAVDDLVEATQSSSQNVLSVLTNDNQGLDAGVNETLTVSSVTTGSAGGTIQIGSSGTNIRYTPATGFTGTETFNYTLSDGRGGTDVATVTVTVRPAVPPPTVLDDSFTIQEDSAQASHDVLANDVPASTGGTLRIRSVGSSSKGSTTSVSSDGNRLLYRPAANLAGQEVITYTVESSNGGITTGRVTFTMTNTNDAPTATDDTPSVLSPSGVSAINVLANDSDVDPNDVLTITAVTQPPSGSGTVAITDNGKSLSYTPPSNNFTGNFSFSYTVTDSTGLTDTATAQVTVRNYTPRSVSGSLQFNDQGSGVLSQVPLTLAGTNVDGAAVNTRVVVGANGQYSFNNLEPGDYRLKREALPFLNDSGEEIVINSAPSDGNLTKNMVVTASLEATNFGIKDFLGSSLLKSLTAAIDSSNRTSWQAASGSWGSLSGISFQINTANLVINAVNSTQQNVTATIPLTHGLLDRTVGNGHQLIKLRGDSTKFQLAPVTTTSSTGPAGEGEPAENDSNASVMTLPRLATNAVPVETRLPVAINSASASTVLRSEPVTAPAPSSKNSLLHLLGSNQRISAQGSGSQLSQAAVDQIVPAVGSVAEQELGEDPLDLLASTGSEQL